jgi:hypothetical protein
MYSPVELIPIVTIPLYWVRSMVIALHLPLLADEGRSLPVARNQFGPTAKKSEENQISRHHTNWQHIGVMLDELIDGRLHRSSAWGKYIASRVPGKSCCAIAPLPYNRQIAFNT